MEWAKVLLMKTCLKASTSPPSHSTRAARSVTHGLCRWFSCFLFVFPSAKLTSPRLFSGVCQFWATFQAPSKGPEVPAGENFFRDSNPYTPLTHVSCRLILCGLFFFPPSHSDERYGLGSCDRAHTGRHAVPRRDGRGRATQPSVGRMNTQTRSQNLVPLSDSEVKAPHAAANMCLILKMLRFVVKTMKTSRWLLVDIC